VTEAMKSYALEKLAKIDKFGGRVLEATVILDVQKLDHTVEYIINVNNTKINVIGHSINMYAAIDLAIDKLKAKLSRYLRRLHEHHAKAGKDVEMSVNVIQVPDYLSALNDEIEEENIQRAEQKFIPHHVVSQETMMLKTLTLDEALMKMELSGDAFLIYRGEEDQQLKLIYRRKDSNYAIVDVEPSAE
jgi:putative sigma-54 modulation protein